jgi:hypothetical protein
MSPTPLFLDFEASSLASASYPIEVAWSRADDSVESHLISPAGIMAWTDWSIVAQRLHGLSREQLLTDGRPPAWVARRMNEQLAGQTLYSDNPDYDGFWLEELFRKAAGLKPAFSLLHIDELLIGLVCPEITDRVRTQSRIKAMKQIARREVVGQHRASLDVKYLLALYALAKEEKN